MSRALDKALDESAKKTRRLAELTRGMSSVVRWGERLCLIWGCRRRANLGSIYCCAHRHLEPGHG